MSVSQRASCPYCPAHSLDSLGHHALTCKHGGDVVTRHNRRRDVFVESCWRACVGVQVEVGSGYGLHEHNKQPADVLAANWMLGKPAAFDSTVTSPLVSKSLVAGVQRLSRLYLSLLSDWPQDRTAQSP